MARVRPGPMMVVVGAMLLMPVACLAAGEQVVLHVAPGGSDDAVGSRQAPFRTLTRARDEISRLKQADGPPDGGARVGFAIPVPQ